jgi:hypothetical protein
MVKIPTKDWWTRERKERARPILLEISPFGVDGGELIGRDPRQIAAHEFDVAGIAGAPILDVIRAKCLDCCVEQADEVRKCVAFSCPNWPYRMGANPFRTPRVLTEEQRERSAAALARARTARTVSAFQDAPPAILDSKSASPKSDGGSSGAQEAQKAQAS